MQPSKLFLAIAYAYRTDQWEFVRVMNFRRMPGGMPFQYNIS